MTTPEIITASKDVLLGFAAIITASVAILGLKKWSVELKGKAEFEAARNLIRATYKLRDAIQSCRSPFMSTYEYPESSQDNLITSSTKQEQEAEALAYAYNNRMQPVWDALRELDLHTLEAEVLWGKGIRVHTDQLRRCVNRLFVAIQDHIENKKSGGKNFKKNEAYAKRTRNTIYASLEDKDNKLSTEITSVVTEIEKRVNPHLYRMKPKE